MSVAPSGISLPFSSAEEELRYVLGLLDEERLVEQEEFRREWTDLPLSRRRALGITIFPVEFSDAAGTLGERWKLHFSYESRRHSGGEGRHRFQVGQIVEIFRSTDEGQAVSSKKAPARDERVSGVLAELRADRLTIITSALPDWLEDGRVGVDLAFNETTYREMERALRELLEDRKLAARRDILLGYAPARKAGDADADARDGAAAGEQLTADVRLNPAQVRAVAGILGLGSDDFVVVHGPPGTGKTTTIVAAIRGLLARGERVLVTAPTNAAADLLAALLLDAAQGDAQKPKALLRLGHPARVNEAIWRHTLEGSLDAHPEARTVLKYRSEADALHKKARRFRRNFGPAERAERAAMLKEHAELRKLIRSMEHGLLKHVIERADVVVTTLVGAASERLRDITFDCAVIDEATQALEPAAWIPLRRASKWIMAGDHCQLPPTVKSANGLTQTLFEKTITRHQDPARVFFLDTQYRMEPAIVAFSNAWFYENRLITDESVIRRTVDSAPEFAGFAFTSALIFVDTAGCDFNEELDPESASYRNPGEARLLRELLQGLAPELIRRSWRVGVIATYRNQTTLLRDILQDGLAPPSEEIDMVEIDTVDAFQGRETDVVCISLVRSNESGETGFLGEIRRLNVALTRARHLLIVVGDSATLASHPFYERFIEHVRLCGDYRSAYEFLDIA